MAAAITGAVPAELAGGQGAGPAPTRIVVAYGFWIFIISDIRVKFMHRYNNWGFLSHIID